MKRARRFVRAPEYVTRIELARVEFDRTYDGWLDAGSDTALTAVLRAQGLDPDELVPAPWRTSAPAVRTDLTGRRPGRFAAA